MNVSTPSFTSPSALAGPPEPHEESGTDRPAGPAQPVTVNVTVPRSSEETHGWKVLGTLLIVGAATMIGWGLAKAGLLEIGATAVTMLLATLARFMIQAGLLVLPEGNATGDFAETRSFLRRLYNEFNTWIAKSSVLRLTLIAVGYTIVFMIIRQLFVLVFKTFGNVWLAGGAGMAVAAVVVSPTLFGRMKSALTSRVRSS